MRGGPQRVGCQGFGVVTVHHTAQKLVAVAPGCIRVKLPFVK